MEETFNLSKDRSILPKMAGMAIRKAKEKLAVESRPINLLANMVLAEREIPGTNASA